MFKKIIFASLTGLIAATSFAQAPAPSNQMPPMKPGMMQQGQMPAPAAMDPAKFAEHKQNILNRMSERDANAAEAKACVQKATTPADLQACRKERQEDRQGMKQQRPMPPGGMQGQRMGGQPPAAPQK